MSYGLLCALSWGTSTLLLFRERMAGQQIGGTILILAGLVLLGLGSSLLRPASSCSASAGSSG